ncbi:unnamed protein product [Linum tenue]|nr:unnamed protein product [Linum tenue]
MKQSSKTGHWWWWVKVSLYTMSVLLGQSVAVLLGRLYFLKGGSSNWLSSVVQVGGFPILIPFYLLTTTTTTTAAAGGVDHDHDDHGAKPPLPSPHTLTAIYALLGLVVGFACWLYSVGLQNLPVSTYTLLSASQLAFNSFFSYFINGQKFTPFVVNSLVLLTVSSVLLVFNDDDSSAAGPTSRVKYVTGFLCTLAASALFGLLMSATQYVFTSVIKRRTFKYVMDMIIYQNLFASLVTVVGLFASGEWKGIGREMEGYGLGTTSYLMTLIWIAVFWQLFSIGAVGLIFEVSSLFSNSISVVGLPIVPIAAIFFFHDKMSGVKGISMVLAIWGFVSYVYQFYVDDKNSRVVKKAVDETSR